VADQSGSESHDFKDTVGLVNPDNARVLAKLSQAVSQSEKTAYFAESQPRSLKENLCTVLTIEEQSE
jgi:hypothetical protein